MPKIVFVCTVNRWRSPMAEYLFRDVLKEEGVDSRIEVSSAGIVPKELKAEHRKKGFRIPRPLFGYRSLPCIMFYLMKAGIDTIDFRSKPLTYGMVKENDLIIPIVKMHEEAILNSYPGAKEKVVSLEELSYPFELMEIRDEPPGLMPPINYCLLKCDHWDITEKTLPVMKDHLQKALDGILFRLGL